MSDHPKIDPIAEGDLWSSAFWDKVWGAYWDEEKPHGTQAALECVIRVVREYDASKGALASASSGLISHVRSSEGIVSEIAGEGPAASTTTWQLIDTAPKDGSEIVAHDAATGTSHVTLWRHGGWHDPDSHYYSDAPDFVPTHWMPLPKPPTTNTTLDEQESAA